MIGFSTIKPVAEVTLWPKDAQHATAAAGTFTTVNEVQVYDTYDFDQTTGEAVSFALIAPKAARFGATVYWTAASGAGGVLWQMQCAATPPGGDLDAPDGGAILNSGVLSGTTLLQMTELPIGEIGASMSGALLNVDLLRVPANAADTLNADARLLCIVVRFYS